jgi:DNA-binding LacI/PurR family transcriptional regulator
MPNRDIGSDASPADVSIVGVDDRPFAAHLPISLTTIAPTAVGVDPI